MLNFWYLLLKIVFKWNDNSVMKPVPHIILRRSSIHWIKVWWDFILKLLYKPMSLLFSIMKQDDLFLKNLSGHSYDEKKTFHWAPLITEFAVRLSVHLFFKMDFSKLFKLPFFAYFLNSVKGNSSTNDKHCIHCESYDKLCRKNYIYYLFIFKYRLSCVSVFAIGLFSFA